MRVRFLSAFGLVAVCIGALAFGGACKAKGNGVGTAPPDFPCPAPPETMVVGTPCPSLGMCGACGGNCGGALLCAAVPLADAGGEVDASATVSDPDFYMFCPGGTGAVWECVQAGDGGPLLDADAEVDGGEVDGDASESESDVVSDADADGAESSEAEVASDAPSDADAIDEADAATDTAPEVDLDADADGD
jgi:hypothetical protein